MVAAGYVNNDRDDNHDGPRQGNNYYGSSSRSAGRDSRPKQSGADVAISHRFWRKKFSTEGVLGTPTSTRMGGENPHISSSSAGSFFGSVKCFRRRCDPNNQLQAVWLTMHHHHLLIRRQMWCSKATRPPRSSMSSYHGSRSLKKKHSHSHEVLCP
jgi:hypothetical protein